MEEDNSRYWKKVDRKLHVLTCFLDKKRNPEELTWNQIEERSGYSKGTLHNYIVELFKEGELKGEVRVINDKLVNIFFLGHPEWAGVYGGKEADPHGESVRFYFKKGEAGKGTPIFAQVGVMRSMKKVRGPLVQEERGKFIPQEDKTVFCGTGPILPVEPPKPDETQIKNPVKRVTPEEAFDELRKAVQDARSKKKQER